MEHEWLGPEPIYRQLAGILRARIADGTYRPGYPVPSTRALAAEFGVTPRTVRRAVDILTGEGLLVGAIGRGMYVTRPEDRPAAGEQASD